MSRHPTCADRNLASRPELLTSRTHLSKFCLDTLTGNESEHALPNVMELWPRGCNYPRTTARRILKQDARARAATKIKELSTRCLRLRRNGNEQAGKLEMTSKTPIKIIKRT